MQFPEKLLPHGLLARATRRGNEYAWSLEDIPKVISAAKEADLVSIGGQLQFRFPHGGTCECYWVEVDTHKAAPKSLPWSERVECAAEAALADFHGLRTEYDFHAEGRSAFAEEFRKFEARGGDPAAAMCFVWYVASPDEDTQLAGV